MPPSIDHSGAGARRQRDVFVAGLAGAAPPVPADYARLEAAAQRAMSAAGFAYVAGSAGEERTADANRAAFLRHPIVPRVLRGADPRSLSLDLFGETLPAPVLLAPIGVLEMAHRDADLAVARAAAALGVPFVFSSQASVPMEETAAAMDAVRPGAPRWFQLYWSTDDDLVRSFVQRAERCGCSAIVLTLDTTLLGWRPARPSTWPRSLSCTARGSRSTPPTRCSCPSWTSRCPTRRRARRSAFRRCARRWARRGACRAACSPTSRARRRGRRSSGSSPPTAARR